METDVQEFKSRMLHQKTAWFHYVSSGFHFSSGKFRAKEKPPTSVGGFPSLGGPKRVLRLNSFVIWEPVTENILVCLIVEFSSSDLVGLVAFIDRDRIA